MDLVGSQRFPLWLIRASSAGGAALVLYSAYSLPFAQVGFPLLLLALSSAVLSLKYSGPPPHDRRHIPVAEFFIILALLLFGNEAALLAAALTVACTSLASSRSTGSVLLRFGVTVLSTALFLFVLHVGYGPASALQTE